MANYGRKRCFYHQQRGASGRFLRFYGGGCAVSMRYNKRGEPSNHPGKADEARVYRPEKAESVSV